MGCTPRFMVTNRIQATATALTASGSGTTSPPSRLKDQLRSKSWRSPVGWVIVAGSNDKIDFNRGGVKAATVAAGTYATGAALAAAVVTALEAADSTPVWACSYSGSTYKFTISTSSETFTLLFSTGTNVATSIHLDMGFTSTDKSAAASQTAEGVAYQSRHAMMADLGSAAGVQVGIVINHNSGSGGTYTLQGSASTLAATGYGTSPTVNQALSGDTNIRIAFLSAEQTYRYWRLLINDVTNSLGYAEVGIWYAGPYTQPTVSYAIGFTKSWEELSEVSIAIGGAHFQDEKARRPVWSLNWLEVESADRSALAAAFALVPKGRNFFLAFDAVTTPTDTEYGYLAEGVSETLTSNLYHDVAVPVFAGALG